MMRTERNYIHFLLAAAFLALGMLMWKPAVVQAQEQEASQPKNPIYDEETDTTDWSYVYFGSYPQTEVTGEALTEEIIGADYDSNGDAVVGGHKYYRLSKIRAIYSENGRTESFYDWQGRSYAYFKYEPIRWRVLENDGETLLLMADQILDCRQYNRGDGKVTWDISHARAWLNGYDSYDQKGMSFATSAFTEKELQAVQTTNVTGSGNPFHGIDGGKNVEDKIFLLSIEEVMNPDYGFPADIISYTKTRRMETTDFAFASGTWKGTYNEEWYGSGFWLLRSPGSYQQAVSLVYPFGHVYQDGYYADERYYGICPALRVDVDSQMWSTTYPAIVYGDMNEDKKVDLEDARIILRTALKLIRKESDNLLQGDVNGDGSITIGDARLALMRSLQIIAQFPVEEEIQDGPSTEKKPYVYQPDVLTYPEQTEYAPTGTIWIAADSIAASHGKSGQQPLYGWGELFGDYFTRGVTIQNTAISGSSTKSFATSSNYSNIMRNMTAGDYLLISFGHNDERGALSLYADPAGGSDVRNSFKWNLKHYYIDPAIEKGVTPVLISPVVRRYFWQGEFLDPQLHAAYGTAMEELAQEYAEQGIQIPFIDLHGKMSSLYHELGEEGTGALHGMSGGVYDNTHLSRQGAEIVCRYIIEEMQEQQLSICEFLK